MSLFSRAERRMASLTSPAETWARDVFPTTSDTASGVPVGSDSARTLTSVWACQSLIADGISSLPKDAISVTTDGKRKPTDPPPWFDAPNPFETWYTFCHKLMISLLGAGGNAFVRTVRNGSGVVQTVWVIDPAFCVVDETSDTPIVTVNGERMGPDELMHIPAFTIPGRREGLSIIANAAEAIGLGLAAEEFGARFFSQGTTMSGVIEHPGKPTPTETAILARMMKKTHSGMKNSHAVGVLSGGASFRPISITPNEAQFLETRRFQAVQIAALYRVPPHLIDPSVQSSWGSGIEEQNAFFAEYTLVPWLTRLEQAFSRLLPFGQVIKWNLDAKLRAKLSERYAAYAQGVTNGFLNLDEIREKEDFEPIPGGLGEKHFMPANLVELGKEPPPAPAPVPGADANPKAVAAKPADPKPVVRTAAQIEEELRHLPGKHNQESHGNRIGKSKLVPSKTGLGKKAHLLRKGTHDVHMDDQVKVVNGDPNGPAAWWKAPAGHLGKVGTFTSFEGDSEYRGYVEFPDGTTKVFDKRQLEVVKTGDELNAEAYEKEHPNWRKNHPEYGAPAMDVNAGYGNMDDTYRRIPSKAIKKTSTEVGNSGQPPMTHAGGTKLLPDATERKAYWEEKTASWGKVVSTSEKNATQQYTGSYYHEWNSSLRYNGVHSDSSSESAASGLRAGYIDEDVMVFRGASSGSWSKDLKPGQLFHDQAFTSTATSPGGQFGGDMVFRIRLPKGTRGAYVDPISHHKGEQEFALPPGTTYKVHAITEKGGKKYLDVTVTHQGTRKNPDGTKADPIKVKNAGKVDADKHAASTLASPGSKPLDNPALNYVPPGVSKGTLLANGVTKKAWIEAGFDPATLDKMVAAGHLELKNGVYQII